MSLNDDGTANCDTCNLHLDGYGVLFGMVTTDVPETVTWARSRIFCYENECRSAMLAGMVNFPGSNPVCTRCGDPTPRAIAYAVLAFDMNPVSGEARGMVFCYANHCANAFWANNTGGTA